MMSWNKYYYMNPSSFSMEIIQMVSDYVSMFLCSIMILVIMNLIFGVSNHNFDLGYMNNNTLENIWTILPSIVLILLAFPSLYCLQTMESCQFCGELIKIIGHQWYWSYELKNFLFDSYLINESVTLRLLEVDNNLILPSNVNLRFIISSTDVIHSWTLPSLGVKVDAIPGRINQVCVISMKNGLHFGQCSEICGSNHSLMPIVVEFVNFKSFYNIV